MRNPFRGATVVAVGLVTAATIPLGQPAAHAGTTPSTADMTGSVIYQLMTDRFADGNTANDDPAGATGLYSTDHSNWQLYWGGDFAGVTAHMQYLKDLGVGAIWISPPVKNVNVAVPNGSSPMAGYHGYWGMDFYVPDPHFGSWSEFDTMVSTAHAKGIRIVMDWAANHSNPEDVNNPSYGADGLLQQNGVAQSEYDNDPGGWFHHNGGVSDYSNLYDAEYQNLFNLADLAQENPKVTSYLQGAVDTWLSHGVDGIRMDAVKHMPGGWLKGYADHVYSSHSVFTFGEWADPAGAPLWNNEVQFANGSGQSLQNFDLNNAVRGAFTGGSMADVDAAIQREAASFTYPNQLVNMLDCQDMSRFLSVTNNTTLFDQASVVTMTAPGIPSIYYGDEQYLHNDTTNSFGQVGGDPYNRPMMTSFDESSRNFAITSKLSALRSQNPALRYGTSQQRWLNSDVYVYERRFYDNVVLVAVNKSSTTSYTLTNLNTALPAGSYSDVLGGSLGGGTLTVSAGSNGNNPVGSYVLKGGQAAVWSSVASAQATPRLGNVGPTLGHPGNVVTVAGTDFGTTAGSVTVGGVKASISTWANDHVDFVVPSVAAGSQPVAVVSSAGATSNTIAYHVDSGTLTPVTFTTTGANTSYGDQVYLTGSTDELGNWSTDPAKAIGPLNDPAYPTWFILASVPAGQNVQYKYFIKKVDGSIQWESGANHTYTVPTSGTGAVTTAFQP